jgi:hypothetical protein
MVKWTLPAKSELMVYSYRLVYENQEIKAPEWHKEVLEERKKTIAEGIAEFVSLSELKASRKR